MGLLDIFTGGSSASAEDAQKKALAALEQVQTPSIDQMTLPELQKYSVAANMTPAQMQAFLQQKNALEGQQIDQTGTSAQKAALAQLADVAQAGPEGTAMQKAQVENINQEAARNLAGQRGAIDQQAQARGVPVGLLQAALGQQQAGQGLQDAHMAALQAQGQNYQQALSALASGGTLGGQLQGQQNTQANTVANAANAMAQFNAANQQNAAAQNSQQQQAANAYNTQQANQTGQANTALANERTQYNTGLAQQNFANQMAKQGAVAGGYGNLSNMYTGQGQQNAGIASGLIGAGATLAGGMMGGPVGAAAGNVAAKQITNDTNGEKNAAHGAYVADDHQGCMHEGGLCLKGGGMIPGHAKVPGDSIKNDTVHIMASPGEAVIPRTAVQHNPGAVAGLLQSAPEHDPRDVAALLAAMKHIRGGSHAV